MNFWDVFLSAVIIAALVLAVAFCVRKKARGDSCCGGDCAGCRSRCGQEKDQQEGGSPR